LFDDFSYFQVADIYTYVCNTPLDFLQVQMTKVKLQEFSAVFAYLYRRGQPVDSHSARRQPYSSARRLELRLIGFA